jgi:hypothetical protein
MRLALKNEGCYHDHGGHQAPLEHAKSLHPLIIRKFAPNIAGLGA